jgi:hypothetical protein
MDKDGYHGYATSDEEKKAHRNEVIDEVAQALQQFSWAFGADTVSSFVVFIKGLKDE